MHPPFLIHFYIVMITHIIINHEQPRRHHYYDEHNSVPHLFLHHTHTCYILLLYCNLNPCFSGFIDYLSEHDHNALRKNINLPFP
jgi:hypothetical protein